MAVAVEAIPDRPATVSGPERRLGQILLEEGLITEEDLSRALDAQRITSTPLGTLLVNQGAIQEDRLTLVLSIHLDTPMADLKHVDIDAEIAQLVPETFARRNLVLPLRRDNGYLAVAMSDPSNVPLLNDIRLITGLPVSPYIAGPSDILVNLTRIHTMHPRLNVAAQTLRDSRPQSVFNRGITLELLHPEAATVPAWPLSERSWLATLSTTSMPR